MKRQPRQVPNFRSRRDVRHLKGLIPKPARPVSIKGMHKAVARAGSGK